MRTTLIALLALSLSACASLDLPSPTPEPFIGEIVSTELLFGEPYRNNYAIQKPKIEKGEVYVIRSNACGYAKAGFQDINAQTSKPRSITIGRIIGEWCRNPYRDIKHHREYLVVPIAKNTNRPWQRGSFTGAVLEVHKTDNGRFADVYELDYYVEREVQFLEAGQSQKSDLQLLQEKITELGIGAQIETLPSPDVIRRLEDSEELELSGLEKDLYAVENGKLFLVKGLRADSFYGEP